MLPLPDDPVRLALLGGKLIVGLKVNTQLGNLFLSVKCGMVGAHLHQLMQRLKLLASNKALGASFLELGFRHGFKKLSIHKLPAPERERCGVRIDLRILWL